MDQVVQTVIELVGFGDRDRQCLKRHAATTRGWVGQFLKDGERWSARQESLADVRDRIGQEALRDGLRRWYLHMTGGDGDDHFWARQWGAGATQVRYSVNTPIVLGAVSVAQQWFQSKCSSALEPVAAGELFFAFKRITDIASTIYVESSLTTLHLDL